MAAGWAAAWASQAAGAATRCAGLGCIAPNQQPHVVFCDLPHGGDCCWKRSPPTLHNLAHPRAHTPRPLQASPGVEGGHADAQRQAQHGAQGADLGVRVGPVDVQGCQLHNLHGLGGRGATARRLLLPARRRRRWAGAALLLPAGAQPLLRNGAADGCGGHGCCPGGVCWLVAGGWWCSSRWQAAALACRACGDARSTMHQ